MFVIFYFYVFILAADTDIPFVTKIDPDFVLLPSLGLDFILVSDYYLF